MEYAPLKMYTFTNPKLSLTILNYPKNKAIRIMEGLLYTYIYITRNLD